MTVVLIKDDKEKQAIARDILEGLPEWFGIPEAREDYIRNSVGKLFFCALDEDKPIGLCT